MGVLECTRALLTGPLRRQRRAWSGTDRALIEVRGLDGPSALAVADEVQAALARVAGVALVSAHPVLGRVTVAFGGRASPGDLLRAVEESEARAGVAGLRFTPRPDHPADAEPLVREGVAVAVAVVGALAHLARLPAEAVGLVSFAQSQPRVRGVIESIAGTGPTDVGLGLANAVALGLGRGPLGLR